MDMILNICISDGSEIIVDGFDKISFYNEIPVPEVTHSGYTWRNDFYNDLLNNLCEYKFISVKRNDVDDELKYRDHSFAFRNQAITKNEPLILRTSAITTIIDMYK